MPRRALGWLSGCGLALLVGSALAAPAGVDIERSVQLRERWMTLTEGFAGPVVWDDARTLRYRRTVPGGSEFVSRTLGETAARPSFDHAALAVALGALEGKTWPPARLPFSEFEWRDAGRAIRFQLDAGGLRQCRLAPAQCEVVEPDYAGQPRGWGVVRDQSVPPRNDPQPSPDGRHEVFLREGALVLRRTADGSERLVAPAPAGVEVFDPESLVWAPDSRHAVLYLVTPGTQRRVTRVESAPRDRLQPRVHTQLYPKPGDAVDIEVPVIIDVAHGTARRVDTALFPQPLYLSPPYFRADGRSFAFREVERDRKRVRLIEVDAASGAARTVIEETADTFVNDWWQRGFFHDVGRRGEEILWMSERDGWNHLYLFDGKTGAARQLTRGEWVVREVIRVDEARRELWFAASGREPGDPYFRHYYRVGFDGRHLTHLTPGNGWHELSLSPDQKHYVDTWSRLDRPPLTELRAARSGRRIATLETGRVEALEAAGYRPPETFVAPGRDGVTPIYGIVVRPTHYDPMRRYPVIEAIYAGPHDSYVPKAYWPFGRHSGGDKVIGMQALADLGFIVVQMDGMGTMNRSKAFHDVAWKNLQDAGFPDRIAWHRALAARDRSYDLSRGVGIYGASAGGQNALHALEFHGDFYTVAVAMNGCYDNRMDKLSWNEQWLGWPVDESYERASAVAQAHRLQGRLLLILGEQDANVDPASTYQLVDALIAADKRFELLVVPGGSHAVGRSDGPIDYVQRRIFEFFLRQYPADGAAMD